MDKLGVSAIEIIISIGLALFHMVLEVINLLFEAIVSDTSFKDYFVCCYNAREYWLPQQNDFMQASSDERNQNTIQFDHKDGKFCGMGYSIVFKFTD